MFGLISFLFFGWLFWILLGYFYYDRLIVIFILFFFLKAILNWNFRLLDFDFFVGLMLYYCLRRWPNIKTTLRRRFVFDGITTVNSMLICSIWKVLLFISNTQCWFKAEQLSELEDYWQIPVNKLWKYAQAMLGVLDMITKLTLPILLINKLILRENS